MIILSNDVIIHNMIIIHNVYTRLVHWDSTPIGTVFSSWMSWIRLSLVVGPLGHGASSQVLRAEGATVQGLA